MHSQNTEFSIITEKITNALFRPKTTEPRVIHSFYRFYLNTMLNLEQSIEIMCVPIKSRATNDIV